MLVFKPFLGFFKFKKWGILSNLMTRKLGDKITYVSDINKEKKK